MRVLGIVSEYNPFHNGHKYHLEKSKMITEADCVVAVMSGNFVQKGEPAFSDKWFRAKMAVLNGVDLVIENPFIYSCNSAQYFAKGAVGILDGLGCVDCISFGSEAGLIEKLDKFTVEGAEIKERLSKALKEGMPYPRAIEYAYMDYDGVMTTPNNILGIEYIKELKRLKSKIIPMTISRSDFGYHASETAGIFASATKIRQMAADGEDYSSYVNHSYDGYVDGLDYSAVMSRIMSLSAEALDALPSAGEGIGNRIKKVVRESKSIDELVDNVRGKRYTKARIYRILCQMLVGCYPNYDERKYYGRVLALNGAGAALLKYIGKTRCNKIKLISNINKADTSAVDDVLKYDIIASDMYNLMTGRDLYEYSDYVKKPFIMG